MRECLAPVREEVTGGEGKWRGKGEVRLLLVQDRRCELSWLVDGLWSLAGSF